MKLPKETIKHADAVRTDEIKWRSHLHDRTYLLMQVVEQRGYQVVCSTLDLNDFTPEQVQDALDFFGYGSMEDLRETYGDGADGVLAECLFECMDPDFWEVCGPHFCGKEDAIAYAGMLMGPGTGAPLPEAGQEEDVER